jgi:hypothetical protein
MTLESKAREHRGPFRIFLVVVRLKVRGGGRLRGLASLPGMAALAFDARHRVCFPASASFTRLDPILFAARLGWRGCVCVEGFQPLSEAS